MTQPGRPAGADCMGCSRCSACSTAMLRRLVDRLAAALVRATDDEEFDITSGGATVEHLLPGEVVWRDDLGVTSPEVHRLPDRAPTVVSTMRLYGRPARSVSACTDRAGAYR
jgi:hypothetical protein